MPATKRHTFATRAEKQRKYGPPDGQQCRDRISHATLIYGAQGHYVTPARYEQLHHKGADCANIDHANPRNMLLSASTP